jgi:hypothetical protein
MIEDHAEQLTGGVVRDLQSNPRTAAYHQLSQDELHERAYPDSHPTLQHV